jgi:hypothetical protein
VLRLPRRGHTAPAAGAGIRSRRILPSLLRQALIKRPAQAGLFYEREKRNVAASIEDIPDWLNA